jgi:hypothetical protein
VTQKEAAELLSIEGHEVRVTNPDKPYFSKQAKLSKLDIVRYYLSIAPGALSGIVDRPIVLKRFVNGAEGEAFYQKRAPTDRPAWLRTTTLSFSSGRTAEELVVDNAAGLAWIVNLGCIELHPHPVRSDDLDHPDELRVDLDPEGIHLDMMELGSHKGFWCTRLELTISLASAETEGLFQKVARSFVPVSILTSCVRRVLPLLPVPHKSISRLVCLRRKTALPPGTFRSSIRPGLGV